MGTVYRVAPGGAFTSLFSFNSTNGSAPDCTLIFGADGRLYGTTSIGGAYSQGTAFAITLTNGVLSSITLYNFGVPPGIQPSELMQGVDGNYYGTANSGGESTNGVFFRLTPPGLYTTLFSFNITNGANPTAGVVQSADGEFYGTTSSGGPPNLGTVFKCTADRCDR